MKRNVIEAAISLATNVFNVWSRHGAVIFTDNKILGRGYNRKYSGEMRKHFTIHAEADALGKAFHKHNIDEIVGAYCLVIRLNKSGNLTNSKPCPDCQAMLREFGIKKVFYSTTGGEMMEMKL